MTDFGRRMSKTVGRTLDFRINLAFLPQGMVVAKRVSIKLYPMFHKYAALAVRNLRKNPVFSAINIVGLSLGMIAFLLLTQYVAFERSYNAFHPSLNQLYRVIATYGSGEVNAYTPPGMGARTKTQAAGVADFCRIAEGKNLGTGIVSYEPTGSTPVAFRENDFAYVDGSFFQVFSFPLVDGSASSFAQPNSAAISKSTATKYFGKATAVGKVFAMNNQFGKTLYTVQAVYDDMPSNSDIRYDFVLSLETLASPANLNDNDWASLDGMESHWMMTYFSLNAGTDPSPIADQLVKMMRQANEKIDITYALQPMASMHLGQSLGDTAPKYGSLSFVYLLSAISILILVIAWFNYVNLSTAGALRRAKEVGVRKVVGATRKQLVWQFVAESMLINVVAIVVAIAVAAAIEEPFYAVTGVRLSFQTLSLGSTWVAASAILLGGMLLSGFYTAFVLSSFQPAKVLKGVFSKSSSGVLIRKALVVAQFTISVVLIASTIVLFQQWQFMADRDLGIEADQLLVIRGASLNRDATFGERSEAFEKAIRDASFVEGYCRSGDVPAGGFNFSTSGITKLNPNPGDDQVSYEILMIDERYADTYGIPMASGKTFTPEMCMKSLDENYYMVVNERAAETLGFGSAEEAVGQKVKWGDRQYEIRGVMKNYHHQSLQFAISPIVFFPSMRGGYYTLKVNTANMGSNLAQLEAKFKESFPSNPFEYQFLDETFKAKYEQEKQYGLIFTAASALAILIGCMGLFGLAIHTVEQRTKEIGIRKVLGSPVSSIIRLLTVDFLLLVTIAFVLAIPLTWWGVQQWLQGFAYRVDVQWWVFAIAGLVTFLIAFVTVGTQAFKGATANPVTALRRE